MGRKLFVNHTELPYHITARCINREWFSVEMPYVWEIMSRNLYFINHAFDLRIHNFVLMSNHFHLLVRTPEANLSEAMQFFMLQTSRELTQLSGRINCTYGNRFHRSLIATPLYYLHAYKYVYRNPVEAGLCKNVEDYRYSSIQGLLGEKWLDVPVREDDNWGSFRNRDATLKWLNTKPSRESWEDVLKGLKKSEFKLARRNNRKSALEDDAL